MAEERAIDGFEYKAPQGLCELLHSYPRLKAALEDCRTRFLDDLPATCQQGVPLCGRLQEAYWYYLDDIVDTAKRDFPKLQQDHFFSVILETSDVLWPLYESLEARQELFTEFRQHLKTVPRVGAVIMDDCLEKCLMVESWSAGSWSHPCGKLEPGENEVTCAAREVWEETGLDITGRIDEDQCAKAEVPARDGSVATVKLFLVSGISKEQAFVTNTEKEVSRIAWVALRKLPGWSSDTQCKLKFCNVACFVLKLKRWVEQRQALIAQQDLSTSVSFPRDLQSPEAAVPLPSNEAQCVADRPLDPDTSWLNITAVLREFDRGWTFDDTNATERVYHY